MKKLIVSLIVLFFVACFFIALTSKNTDLPNGKVKVSASFYPLAFFAKEVGGDLVEVSNLTPAGAEPHEYEPSIKDIEKIYKSQLFIYNGVGLDSWADKIAGNLNPKTTKTINMSSYFSLIKIENIDDPHFWIDPKNNIKQVEVIADALTDIDPKNKDIYKKRADALKTKLSNLDLSIREGLSKCLLREIVTAHDAFEYFAERYNLRIVAISGVSPDEEPSAKKMAEIVDLVKKTALNTCFSRHSSAQSFRRR
jgi:zinc transport system substrate-binding protein